MSLFGKNPRDYASFTRAGIFLILLMGLARFLVGISGVPYERATHLLSLTILSSLVSIVYGQRAAQTGFGGYRHLLPAVCMLSITMYGFIVAAILVEGLSGIHGYFHAPGSGLVPAGMSIAIHIPGQIVAMLPSSLFFWGLASLGFLLSRYLGYLRNAFFLLVAMAVLRVLTGAAGVPYAIGTWMTSITVLAMVLSVYYAYRAPSSGFARYRQMFLIGILIAGWATLLVIYGIAVTTSLGISSYFHEPGDGFLPQEWSMGHIRAHLQASVLGMLLASILACIALFLAKRSSAAPAGQAA